MQKRSFKKGIIVLFGILVICSMLVTLCSAEEKLRVGTFDSRAIAHAYGLSEMAKPMVSDMRKKYILAKKEGNEELRIELKALQQVMQQQAFSVASVADILEKVEAELPKVAKEAGVDIIVSKWEVMFTSRHTLSIHCLCSSKSISPKTPPLIPSCLKPRSMFLNSVS